MVICQYFLKGTCKFGDRCFNEHRRAENRGSYNQGGHNQRNYQQDSRDVNSGGRYGNNTGRNTGGGLYDKNTGYKENTGYDGGHYDNYNQGYRNQKNFQQGRGNFSGGNRGGGNRDGGRGGGRDGGNRDGGRGGGNRDGGRGGVRDGGRGDGNRDGGRGGGRDGGRDGGRGDGGRDGGHDGGRDGGRDGYSGYGGSQGGRNYGRDKYHFDARDKNRFSALAHQPDPEPPSFHDNIPQQVRVRTHSTTSQQSVTLDQKVERVRKDMREWHESGQWPLSCYAPFVNDPCLDGLVDMSPEEMRSEAYKANTAGNAGSYAKSLQQTMEKNRHRKQELATMSSSALQDEISRSSQPSTALSGGLFGNLASSSDTSLFGESMSTSSTGLFGSSPQSMHTSGPFTSNPASANPLTTPSTLFGPSSSPFGSTQVDNTPSSTSLFGRSQENPSSAQTSTDGTRSATMTSLRCSEEDLKAFRADYFVLGAIPECPPPLELC